MSGASAPLRTTLVLGGARSGKSAHAEGLVRASGLAMRYLATGEAGDAEMAERIAHHRDRRGPGWTTREEPLALVEALREEAGSDRAVLVDCLTLWLSNLFFAERDLDAETARLCEALAGLPGPTVLVSNEVGMGLVPETPLGRRFRDAQGRLNQAVAATVPSVLFVAAGLPLVLKSDVSHRPASDLTQPEQATRTRLLSPPVSSFPLAGKVVPSEAEGRMGGVPAGTTISFARRPPPPAPPREGEGRSARNGHAQLPDPPEEGEGGGLENQPQHGGGGAPPRHA